MELLLKLLVFIPMVILVLTFYSFSKAFIAYKLGDISVKDRLSLNPMDHFEPVSLAIMTIVALLTGFRFIVSWPKPVEYNTYYFRFPTRDEVLVNLAGILGLLLLAWASHKLGLLTSDGIAFAFSMLENIALWFTVWMMLPIRPLDGERVLRLLLPTKYRYDWDRFQERYSFYLFLGVIALLMVFPLPLYLIYVGLKVLISIV